MTPTTTDKSELRRLRDENQRLIKENELLRDRLHGSPKVSEPEHSKRLMRKSAAIFLVIAAVCLLFIGNLFFWAGNTIVKTDRYTETVQPLIGNPEIQTAIASYTSQKLFESVDVEKFTEEVLPPRAAFLAPTLAASLKDNSDDTITKLLARPQFQERWNTANEKAHARFIASVKRNGTDGAINLNEFYQQISKGLKDTKLSFLADKPLPAKVGSIEVVQGKWLTTLQKIINNIDVWRTIAVSFLLVFSFLAVRLSQHRRNTVILLGWLVSISMLVTLVIIRVVREIIAGKVDAQYAEAARQAAQTIFQPLIAQTATILVLGLLIAFVAWVSGPSKNAALLTERIKLLLGGRLHNALFKEENRLTVFIGSHKRLLQWTTIALIAVLLLIIHLTPLALLLSAIFALLIVLAIEVLSAKQIPVSSRRISQ